ncbi:MAG: hypothetical protein VCC00_11365, partial [Deltaproteobacteria bacterium]
ARAGISNTSITNASTADSSNVTSTYADGRESMITVTADDGTTLATRYAFGLGTWNDSWGGTTTYLDSEYTIEFTVTAPGSYELAIDQNFHAAAQTVADSAWGTAIVNLGTVAGTQTGGTIDNGSLSLDAGSVSATTGYGQSAPSLHTYIDGSEAAVISGVSNGMPVTHRLTFAWSQDCESWAYSTTFFGFYPEADHCGIRGGISTPYGLAASDYSTDSGAAAADGHFVTITFSPAAGCGNGAIESGEECDGGACCATDCTFEPVDNVCGGSGDQCNNADTCDGAGSCTDNGAVPTGTGCDDSNPLTDGEVCDLGFCACPTAGCAFNCGDGNLDSAEECDDGNNTGGDWCSALCTIEPGCGNGAIDAGEACDDGNSTDGDGCSSRCGIEAVQSKDQQKCIASQAGYIFKVAKTQAKENALCVKDAGKNKLGGLTLDQCLSADRKQKIAKITAKLISHQSDPVKAKCSLEPDFAYVDAADFIPAVVAEQIVFLDAILGDDAAAMVLDSADRAAIGCQAMIVKNADKLLATRLKEFGSCLQKGLKAKSDPITSAIQAETCWNAGSAKLEKIVLKSAELNVKKCAAKGIDFDTVVAGSCAAETEDADGRTGESRYADCLDERAACRACRILNGTLDLELGCDELDDGVINDSCRADANTGGGSAEGAFVDGPILF